MKFVTGLFFILLIACSHAVSVHESVHIGVKHKKEAEFQARIQTILYRLEKNKMNLQDIDVGVFIDDMITYFTDLLDYFKDDNVDYKEKVEQTYTPKELNPKELFEGFLWGMAGVFVPKLQESESSVDALVTFHMCFNPVKLKEQFYINETLWQAQNDNEDIDDNMSREFADFIQGDWDSLFDFILASITGMGPNVKQVYAQVSLFFKSIKPTIVSLLKHSFDCGYGVIVLGILISFVISAFPPLLFIIVPIAVVGMGIEFWKHINLLIKYWQRDWYKFGLSLGIILGYVAMFIVAYKMSKNGEKLDMECGTTRACNARMPKNEYTKWTRKIRHNGNRVYQRDDLINPMMKDKWGNTNLIRMKNGHAPIGPDGQSINLHHVDQTMKGPLAELTATYHRAQSGTLHKYGSNVPSKINREVFDAWKITYWKTRSAEISSRIAGGGVPGGSSWPLAQVLPFDTLTIVNAVTLNPLAITGMSSFLNGIMDYVTDDLDEGDILKQVVDYIRDGVISEAQAAANEQTIPDYQGLEDWCCDYIGGITPVIVSLGTFALLGNIMIMYLLFHDKKKRWGWNPKKPEINTRQQVTSWQGSASDIDLGFSKILKPETNKTQKDKGFSEKGEIPAPSIISIQSQTPTKKYPNYPPSSTKSKFSHSQSNSNQSQRPPVVRRRSPSPKMLGRKPPAPLPRARSQSPVKNKNRNLSDVSSVGSKRVVAW